MNKKIIQMTPCKNDMYIALNVLGSRITPKDASDYELAVEEYQDKVTQWENNQELNILRGISKPTPPLPLGSNTSYTEMYLNFGYFHIRNWVNDFDPVYQEEIIIVNTVDPVTSEQEYLNIKISKEEWIALLTKLGASIQNV